MVTTCVDVVDVERVERFEIWDLSLIVPSTRRRSEE